MPFELKINIKGYFLSKIFGIINFYVYFCSRFRNNMEKNLFIELLEDGEKVSLYLLTLKERNTLSLRNSC